MNTEDLINEYMKTHKGIDSEETKRKLRDEIDDSSHIHP